MAKPNVREKILEAALDQFHRVGFNGASVDDITTQAGVPKGSFYNHFKSKEILGAEVLELTTQSATHEILRNKSVQPVKRIQQYFGKIAEDFVRSDYLKGCIFGSFASELSDSSEVIRAKLDQVFIKWSGLLGSVIKEGQDSGEIQSPLRAELLAGFIISAWLGTILRARTNHSQGPIKEFSDVLLNQILK